MDVLIAPRQRMAVFWNRKCASRSVTRWFIDDILKADGGSSKKLLDNFKYKYEVGALAVSKAGFLSVIGVRHPALRIVSGYIHKFIKPPASQLNSINAEGQSDDVRQVLTHIYGEVGKADSSSKIADISFNQFLKYLEDAKREGAGVNLHWRPQFRAEYLKYPIEFDYVLSVENFETDLLELNSILGINSSIPKINVNITSVRREISPSGSSFDKFPSNLLSGDLNPGDFLTEEALSRIGKLYEADYRILGYDPMDINSKKTMKSRPLLERPVEMNAYAKRVLGGHT